MLRNLKIQDAPLMLEWMHDKEVVENLSKNFTDMTIKDCENFILKNMEIREQPQEIHLAIVDLNNEYQGTVSLKEIDYITKSAEFAISIRKKAMGTGIAIEATREIFDYGVDNLGIEVMYWCVAPKNKRAVRFYEKNNFARIDAEKLKWKVNYSDQEKKMYFWYCIRRQD